MTPEKVRRALLKQMKDPTITQEQYKDLSERLQILDRVAKKD